MIIYNENYFSKEADMFIWQILLKPKYMFKLFFSTIHSCLYSNPDSLVVRKVHL